MCATAKLDISSFFQGGQIYLKFSCGSAHYWPLLSKNNQVSIVTIERDPVVPLPLTCQSLPSDIVQWCQHWLSLTDNVQVWTSSISLLIHMGQHPEYGYFF